ncbi:MAG: phosphate/phosphite/phosphonate ABC transporter substrate-binding protein [Gammaproteobacteria bacterium]|nr:phosphate/phosphite/phosphonate ABC transporter substrate-binding protein [Gammaproteobacteria bacterium]
MRKGYLALFVVSLQMLMGGITLLHAADVTVIGFGVGPQQSASELAKRWTPLLEYLSHKTGYTIQFQTSKDIPTYQQAMKAGQFDVVYINPYHYTLFHKTTGYDVFAQEKDATLTGIVVVHKDSPYKKMADLNGKDFACPAPTAVTAAVLPMQKFKQLKVSVTPNYVTSHDSVYRAVAKGLYAAGGGELRTFNNMDPEIRDQLRILWSATPLPPFVFAAHPRVSKQTVKRLQEVMVEMDKDPTAAPLLKALNFKGIAPAKDADYDVVRKLNIHMPIEVPKN